MSREMVVVVLGVVVMIVPFLGFPESLREILFIIFGGALTIVGLSLRARAVANERTSSASGTRAFVENGVRPAHGDIHSPVQQHEEPTPSL